MLTVEEFEIKTAHEESMTHRTTLIAALAAALVALTAAPAFAQADLAQKKNCMACHSVDKKVLGPAYKDVAAKYAGQKDAVDKLAVKVVKGGSGVWGNIPMPANPQVTDAEAKQLVQWILTLK
jgi:cytochrome c